LGCSLPVDLRTCRPYYTVAVESPGVRGVDERGEQAIRVAVVGAGAMGRWHVAAAERAGGTVVAVVDRDLARAAALGVGAAYLELERALREHPVDVVHVCTPLESHAEVVRAALASGAHAIVEKPLASDAATTDALLGLADGAGRMLIPVHQFLFQDGVRRVADRRDRLGTIVDVDFVAATAGADVAGAAPDTIVDDILPHPLALFERVAPGSTAGAWDVRRPLPGELRAATTVDGANYAITITTRGRPTRNELVVTGTNATAHVDLFHGFATFEGGGQSRGRKLVRPFARGAGTLGHAGENLVRRAVRGETAYPGLRELVRRTYAAVTDGSPPPITADETRAVAAARDAILASAQ
jgi:predicted dehydrogenase